VTARFEAPAIVFLGANGAGKTNLLEAISLLTPGRGLRGARAAEIARHGVEPWAAVGRFAGPGEHFEVATGTPPGDPPELARRILRLDGANQRGQAALASRVAAVWLTPRMDRLLAEGASDRRRFLDRLALALEPAHAREAGAYETAMAGRNRLLAKGRGDPAWLAALEDSMARHGVAVAAARRALVARLGALLAAGVTGGFPAASLALSCKMAAALDGAPALAVEADWRAAWARDRAGDAAAGGARSGPHRADLLVTHAAKGLPAAQCSTGEQKALLIAIVLAHAALVAEARGAAPLLLLDEVAAHLDAERREALFAALLAGPSQAFLTGTDSAAFAGLRGRAQAFAAAGGTLVPDAAYPMPDGA